MSDMTKTEREFYDILGGADLSVAMRGMNLFTGRVYTREERIQKIREVNYYSPDSINSHLRHLEDQVLLIQEALDQKPSSPNFDLGRAKIKAKHKLIQELDGIDE